MKQTIREPQQLRSIEKKNKIIQAGFELFSEVGYYGTNTAEIAKKAGVSTGIVYGYFKDKRDILIDVLDIYLNKVFEPLFLKIDKLSLPINFEKLITEILNITIKTHKTNYKIHEALHAMASTDEAVNSKFIALEDEITVKISEKLRKLKIRLNNPLEKIHFAMDIIQSFSHEYIFDKHEYIDYASMKKMVIETLVSLLK